MRTDFIFESLGKAIPESVTQSVSEWCRRHVVFPNSARSKQYDPDITPWCVEPMNTVENPERRRTTFIKPIQSGGSGAGEGLLCYWLATKSSGDVQYNWQNDEQAEARWQKRVERIFKVCGPLMQRAPDTRRNAGKWTKGMILFPHCNFVMQGVFTNRNVASDSIKFQINEEIHDEEGWLPGRLGQAIGRTTAHWDHSIFNISNAGRKSSDLHAEFQKGTMQQWQVKCPGCGKWHVMRTQWDEKQPELGGLRYNSEGCKTVDGYDYIKLAPTVRFQMPCGAVIQDGDKVARRAMSLGGRYGEPENPGAAAGLASYSLEAVAVDYISWLDLIMEKHAALKALKYGNIEPFLKYKRERECQFVDDEDRPFFQRITLSSSKKNRDGLKNRLYRFASLDRQQGSLAKGEFPHWWILIRDLAVDEETGKLHSLLVYEGKELTDEDAVAVLRDHDVQPRFVAVDSGDDTPHVYRFCLQHGYNSIKGSANDLFSHEDGGRRIFSPIKPLHLMVNSPATQENPDDEPDFWHYSKAGIRHRLDWLRSGCGGMVDWETPSDVSKDYREHQESEELRERRGPRGETIREFVQLKKRNDLYVCECYIAMLVEMAGALAHLMMDTKEESNDKE